MFHYHSLSLTIAAQHSCSGNTLLLQVKVVPNSKLSGTVVAELLQAECHSRRPTNSIKALNGDSVPDRENAAKIGQEHCDSCVGSLALWLQGNISRQHNTQNVFHHI